MIIPTFPATLPGISFPVKRSPSFQTIEHTAVSGVSTTQSPQAFATYDYDLPFEFLRADSVTQEIQTLMSFYQARLGKGLPFHFNDPDDNQVVGQLLGDGDGATLNFGFYRTMVGIADPIQDAIASGLNVYVNGVLKTLGADYTILTTSQYGTNYGIAFTVAPGNGLQVSADFSYNWLCRFTEDSSEFSKFQYYNGNGLWEAKSIKFRSVLQ
jgi:uncharacterized protein (TIGR02217 family)